MDALATAQRLEEEFSGVPRQLDFWGADVRGLSKCLANSALFSVREKRAPRRRYDEEIIASLNNVMMKYTGTQLDQDDHLVFMQLIHIARTTPLGEAVTVDAAEALRGLGWSDSEESYDRLRDSYKRMLEGTVYVEDRKPKRWRLYGAHLINTIAGDETATGTRWSIVLDRSLARILTGNELTLIDWVRQRRLSALAQWLHSFYATHAAPLPYKAATIYELCGSKYANKASFRQKLKKSLDELIDERFIEGYEIGPRPGFLVAVKRAA